MPCRAPRPSDSPLTSDTGPLHVLGLLLKVLLPLGALLAASLFAMTPYTQPFPSTAELIAEIVFLPVIAIVCGSIERAGTHHLGGPWLALSPVILASAFLLALAFFVLYWGDLPYWVRPEGTVSWHVYTASKAVAIPLGFAAGQRY